MSSYFSIVGLLLAVAVSTLLAAGFVDLILIGELRWHVDPERRKVRARIFAVPLFLICWALTIYLFLLIDYGLK